MPDDERLEAISEALAKLIRRQDEYQQQVDARFARLEVAAGIARSGPGRYEIAPGIVIEVTT